ncbi:MAG: deoxyribose-phosphate aldolase, partial [Candidatus Heimdallarchaeota archaeon]
RELSKDIPTREVLTTSIPYTISSAGKEVNQEYSTALQILVNGGASRIGAEAGISGFEEGLAKYIDHTLLKADATEEEIRKLCEEAESYGFASVCVNPTNVKQASEFLKGSSVKVCTVIGFPLGATTPTVKAIETRDAIANGAEEVDMVINVGALKSGNDDLVRRDIEAVVQAAEGKAIVKVILETALLSKEEIVKGSLLSKLGGADFVKTSTGFSTAGALVEDVALMRKTVGPEMGIKAAGGIRTQEAAEEMIKAGATRIGASASVAIVKGTSKSNEKS